MIQRPAKYATCCACEALKICAPVDVYKGKWFWFCAECTRKAASAWAACCREDGALATQTVHAANSALAPAATGVAT
jgi:hypothetical protein